MKKRIGQCVYCGCVRALTEDHIPPRSLWSKPRPSDLIEVPSCSRCNNGASKDDEYFKTVMVFKDRAGSHPEAMTIRDSVFRALALPKKAGFKRHILNNVGHVSLRTSTGLFLGRAPTFNVNLLRLDRVVVRITKGLYWHHHNQMRLPDDCDVSVWSEDGLRDITGQQALQIQREVVAPALTRPQRSLGRGVLRYWFAPADQEYFTAWIYEFYADVRFLAITMKLPKPAIGKRSHAMSDTPQSRGKS